MNAETAAIALAVLDDLPVGQEFSAADVQRETAWRVFRSAPVGHTMPFRVFLRRLASLGCLRVVSVGPTLYAKV